MANIEQAVLSLINPITPQDIKRQAFDYLESAKRDPNFPSFAMNRILEMDVNLSALNVIFWYLHSLEELLRVSYDLFSDEKKQEFYKFLVSFIDTRQSILDLHVSLLNKFAVLFVRVIEKDFPHKWPNAFEVLMNRYNTNDTYARLFLAVFKVFNEEVVEYSAGKDYIQLAKANYLKDAIRERVITGASEIWRQLLTQENPSLVGPTLVVIADYIDWIPIEISLSFLPFLHKYILNEACQIPAIKCITSLISKGMDPQEKLNLISSLSLISFLQSFNYSAFDSTLSDTPRCIAELVNTLGIQIIDCRGDTMIQPMLELALKCLDNADPLISKAVLDFVAKYIHTLRIKGHLQPPVPLLEFERQNVSNICMIVMRRSQLPSEFDHVGPENSDEEDQFYKYRKELSDLFKKLLGVEATQEPVLDYIISLFTSILSNIEQYSVEQIEVPLFLFFHFGESVTDIGEELQRESKISSLLKDILESNIKYISHKIVIHQFFEVCIRYSTFFDTPNHSRYIRNLLEPLMTNFNNPDYSQAKHAIYMFYRVCMKIPAVVVPHAEMVLNPVIQKITHKTLDAESESLLYKAIGHIIGNKYMPIDVQGMLLDGFLTPLVNSNLDATAITYMGEVLAGFKSTIPTQNLEKICLIVENLSQRVQNIVLDPNTHQALVYLNQKIIVALDENSAKYVKVFLMVLCRYMNPESIENIMKVTTKQLVNQIAIQFKTNLSYVLTRDILDPITRYIISEIPRPAETISDIAQQNIQIRRSFCKMVDALLERKVDFLSPEVLGSFVNYLEGAATNVIEASTPKLALNAMEKLLSLLIESGNVELSKFMVEKSQEVTAALIKMPRINTRNPETFQIALEIARIHVGIARFFKKSMNLPYYIQVLSEIMARDRLNEYVESLNSALDIEATSQNVKVNLQHHFNVMKSIIITTMENYHNLYRQTS